MYIQQNRRVIPSYAKGRQSGKAGKDLVLWIVVAIFIVVSIVGMMVFDDYGQSRMGGASSVKDAADHS